MSVICVEVGLSVCAHGVSSCGCGGRQGGSRGVFMFCLAPADRDPHYVSDKRICVLLSLICARLCDRSTACVC
jgi:hypothetical protein